MSTLADVLGQEFKYKARHLPTNRSWVRTAKFTTRAAFLRELARLNKIDPKVWLYTEIV